MIQKKTLKTTLPADLVQIVSVKLFIFKHISKYNIQSTGFQLMLMFFCAYIRTHWGLNFFLQLCSLYLTCSCSLGMVNSPLPCTNPANIPYLSYAVGKKHWEVTVHLELQFFAC